MVCLDKGVVFLQAVGWCRMQKDEGEVVVFGECGCPARRVQ